MASKRDIADMEQELQEVFYPYTKMNEYIIVGSREEAMALYGTDIEPEKIIRCSMCARMDHGCPFLAVAKQLKMKSRVSPYCSFAIERKI